MSPKALEHLENMEKYHYVRMEHYRKFNLPNLAEIQQKMAETVRACIVVIQATDGKEIRNK